jgi:hypothetical protein
MGCLFFVKKVRLPALPRGASVGKPSGTTTKPPAVAKLWRGKPGFALRATPRSPVAIPPDASRSKAEIPLVEDTACGAGQRGILAKASKAVCNLPNPPSNLGIKTEIIRLCAIPDPY